MKWLTVKEFCHAVGISRMTFYRWIKRGRIPNAVHDGKHWRVLTPAA